MLNEEKIKIMNKLAMYEQGRSEEHTSDSSHPSRSRMPSSA